MKAEVRMESDENGSKFLSDKVAQWYYSHGLFCSTYPFCSISFAFIIVLLSCYPLMNIPLPGNFPIRVTNPISAESLYMKNVEDAEHEKNHLNNDWGLVNITESVPPYSWTGSGPHAYIQQIVMKIGVLPWNDDLYLTDAYRAPLYEIFNLLEMVTNHQDHKMTTLSRLCYHIESINKKVKDSISILPEYSCLTLSPANFWQQNPNLFREDPDLLNTVFEHQNIQKGKISVAEMLFGMHLKDTGIKRYPLRNRRRTLQYSLTLILNKYDKCFFSSLKTKLTRHYNLHSKYNSEIQHNSILTYIYYPGEFNFMEFFPLCLAFLLLFIYIYFSMRKMELVKSKILLAICAVITIFCSLLMSLGLCFFFGLAISIHSKEIFPYLVILVGLENVLVLTKSIISTDIKLDVKIRVAQGLSKEGWSISKNLLTELTILTIGLCTFIPAIQELCIFSIVCLVCDFFLQMIFFVTILAIDTRRVDFDPLTMAKYKNVFSPQMSRNTQYCISQNYKENNHRLVSESYISKKLHRSKSHPRLNDIVGLKANFTSTNNNSNIPKRLRLVNIWARTRFFQRSFMMWMIVWISSITYNSGLITHCFLSPNQDDSNVNSIQNNIINFTSELHHNDTFVQNKTLGNIMPPKNSEISKNIDFNNITTTDTEDLLKLKHTEYEPWSRLSNFHWQAIFNKYNIPISRKYLVILPPIRISHVVSPGQAIALRHVRDSKTQHFQWQNLAAALDPLDLSDDPIYLEESAPFYPSSPMELLLMTILCFISVCVMAYAMVVLYHCVCSRNYAEWRASWNENVTQMLSTQLVFDSSPIILRGHSHNIECVVADHSHIASCCLTGQIKVWDNSNGQLIANIDRNSFFGLNEKVSSYKNTLQDEDKLMYKKQLVNTQSHPREHDKSTESYPSDTTQENNHIDTCKLCNKVLLKNDVSGEKLKLDSQISPILNGMDYQSCSCANKYYLDIPTSNTSDKNYTMIDNSIFRYNTNLIQKHKKIISDKFIHQPEGISQIWCLDFVNNIIGIGCSNGNLEFWEGTSAKFKCLYEDKKQMGVTSLKIIGDKVIAAKITGNLDFYCLRSCFENGQGSDWNFTSVYRRSHIRTGSAGSISNFSIPTSSFGEVFECVLLVSIEAHQQPITIMNCQGNRVLTGSQDHTVKVFRITDQSCLNTLHGHYGPITCVALDYSQAMTAMSGSQDGHLCVWDLLSGACMYSPLAHEGGVIGLTYSDSYVITLGADDKLRTWDRFQGHLLMTITVEHTYSSGLVMLSRCLLVTARAGGLIVWDVRTGEAARQVVFSDRDNGSFVRHLLTDGRSVICDYGKELRLVRFPLLEDKSD